MANEGIFLSNINVGIYWRELDAAVEYANQKVPNIRCKTGEAKRPTVQHKYMSRNPVGIYRLTDAFDMGEWWAAFNEKWDSLNNRPKTGY